MDAAEALKLTAPDLLEAGDHRSHHPGARSAARMLIRTPRPTLVDGVLWQVLNDVTALDSRTRLERRYEKFRNMGRLGVEFSWTKDDAGRFSRGGNRKPATRAAAARLAAAIGVPPDRGAPAVPARARRPERASRFLNPSLDQLHDPMALADMKIAVDRILAAMARKRADRDPRRLRRRRHHVDRDPAPRARDCSAPTWCTSSPSGCSDGYGLQPAAIDRLHADGVALVVSVDCGIRGADAARRARELGVDLIITDHHEPDAELPPALAVINPKRHDCTLSGQVPGRRRRRARSWCRRCAARAGRDSWLPGFVKIAAIGTLADVVPLVGENRVIAKIGLDLLSRGPHKIGLRSLLDVSGLTGKTDRQLSHLVHAGAARQRRRAHEHAGHRHAAAAGAATRRWARKRAALAMQLDGENVRRQEEEATILAAAKKIVQTDPDIGARSVLVVAGEGWHRGVIGIVASKLVDAFHRPAIVLSVEDGVAHGSCRSISRFDMLGRARALRASARSGSAATSRPPD